MASQASFVNHHLGKNNNRHHRGIQRERCIRSDKNTGSPIIFRYHFQMYFVEIGQSVSTKYIQYSIIYLLTGIYLDLL